MYNMINDYIINVAWENSSVYTPQLHTASYSNMFNLSMLSVTFHGRSWALPGGKGSEKYFQLTHTFSLKQAQPLWSTM